VGLAITYTLLKIDFHLKKKLKIKKEKEKEKKFINRDQSHNGIYKANHSHGRLLFLRTSPNGL
jgi:hypothetical protein